MRYDVNDDWLVTTKERCEHEELLKKKHSRPVEKMVKSAGNLDL